MSEFRRRPTINYLDVALAKGERWRYEPPDGHSVAWVAMHKGRIATPATVDAGELAVFEQSNAAPEFEALDEARFVLGSAVKSPHDLALGDPVLPREKGRRNDAPRRNRAARAQGARRVALITRTDMGQGVPAMH